MSIIQCVIHLNTQIRKHVCQISQGWMLCADESSDLQALGTTEELGGVGAVVVFLTAPPNGKILHYNR